jgi:hypothetical protein
MFDRLREAWENLGPRERRLASWLGVVLVVCAFGYVFFLINDGLSALEADNDNVRLLLANLDERRDTILAEKSKQGESVAQIGDTAPKIGDYVDTIAKENHVQVRSQTDKPPVQKGKYTELASQLTLYDVPLDDFLRFVRGLEVTNPTVVTQVLDLKRSVVVKEKLDHVEMTIATYEKAKPKADAGTAAAPAPAAAGEEKKP